MSLDAMKQALEALEMYLRLDTTEEFILFEQVTVPEAITTLRAAIEQKPMTWWHEPDAQMNYRKWQGLTDEEREQFRQWAHPDIIEAIELMLQERNT